MLLQTIGALQIRRGNRNPTIEVANLSSDSDLEEGEEPEEEEEEEQEEDPPDELLSSTTAENAQALLAAQLPNPRSYNQQGPSREAMLADLNLLDPDQVEGPRHIPESRGDRRITEVSQVRPNNMADVLAFMGLEDAPPAPPRSPERDQETDEDVADGVGGGLDGLDGWDSVEAAGAHARLLAEMAINPPGERERIAAIREQEQQSNELMWARNAPGEREEMPYQFQMTYNRRAYRVNKPPSQPPAPKPKHISFLHKMVCQFIDLRETRGGEDRPPNEFLCPLSLHAMCDPVVLSDGILYERAYARRSLDADQISPVTREPLPHKLMFPCKALITLMESWVRLRVDVPEGSSLVVELQVTLDEHAPTEKGKEVKEAD
jgi:hypothetical protein